VRELSTDVDRAGGTSQKTADSQPNIQTQNQISVLIRLRRLAKIARVVLGKYRLDKLLDKDKLPFAMCVPCWRQQCYLAATKRRPRRAPAHGTGELGPIFIKFGQLLSTRPDLVPQISAPNWRICKTMCAPFDSDL